MCFVSKRPPKRRLGAARKWETKEATLTAAGLGAEDSGPMSHANVATAIAGQTLKRKLHEFRQGRRRYEIAIRNEQETTISSLPALPKREGMTETNINAKGTADRTSTRDPAPTSLPHKRPGGMHGHRSGVSHTKRGRADREALALGWEVNGKRKRKRRKGTRKRAVRPTRCPDAPPQHGAP